MMNLRIRDWSRKKTQFDPNMNDEDLTLANGFSIFLGIAIGVFPYTLLLVGYVGYMLVKLLGKEVSISLFVSKLFSIRPGNTLFNNLLPIVFVVLLWILLWRRQSFSAVTRNRERARQIAIFIESGRKIIVVIYVLSIPCVLYFYSSYLSQEKDIKKVLMVCLITVLSAFLYVFLIVGVSSNYPVADIDKSNIEARNKGLIRFLRKIGWVPFGIGVFLLGLINNLDDSSHLIYITVICIFSGSFGFYFEWLHLCVDRGDETS